MREDSVERLLGGAEGDKSTQKFTQNKIFHLIQRKLKLSDNVKICLNINK